MPVLGLLSLTSEPPPPRDNVPKPGAVPSDMDASLVISSGANCVGGGIEDEVAPKLGPPNTFPVSRWVAISENACLEGWCPKNDEVGCEEPKAGLWPKMDELVDGEPKDGVWPKVGWDACPNNEGG